MRITSVQLQFDNTGISDATVYFRYDSFEENQGDQSRQFYFSGNLTISGQEYLANSSVDAMKQLVLQRIQAQVNNPTQTETTPTDTGGQTAQTQTVNTQTQQDFQQQERNRVNQVREGQQSNNTETE